MAPRKEKGCGSAKADKRSGLEEGQNMILKYLQQQNRPYSAIDISANLHNKVTKTYAVKALKGMHERKLIDGKISGKQLVYHAVQEASEEVTAEELANMDQSIEELRKKLGNTKTQEKVLKARLATLESRVSTTELLEQIRSLEDKLAGSAERLAALRQTGQVVSRSMTEEEKECITKEWKLRRGQAMARKRICKEMWCRCTEVLPDKVGSRQEFWETLGLEGML
ncbi:hypothetical protein FQN57_002198 [Myotisia sp. PD_48]|nr:hypothetical protein FQN57_002198 [Myotisia sp. PD_48]